MTWQEKIAALWHNRRTQISAVAVCPSIAERAQRVNWEKVDEILARVPNVPPLSGDKLQLNCPP